MSLTPVQLARAAAGYRALIRAQRFTFKGDDHALKSAHQQTRVLFNRFIPSASATQAQAATASSSSSSPLPPTTLTSAEIDEHIQSAFEIATYLRKNVVQGIKNEEGNYSLRFTSETEQGDNDSIKAPSKQEARPMRAPSTDNSGVRRRRRAKPAADAAPPAGGCCSAP